MRKLATIRIVESLSDIDGADNIQLITIKNLGWKCIVKKDELNVGDMIVYIEIDSIVPQTEVFEFLRTRKFRIKTLKLKNTLSQGLALPVSYFTELKNIKEGLDVTDKLGIKYYDPIGDKEKELAEFQNNIKRSKLNKLLKRYSWYRRLFIKKASFPKFIKRTDEPRWQLIPNMFEDWKDKEFHVTEKLDGSSISLFIIKKRLFGTIFGVCSRNVHLIKPDLSYFWRAVKLENIELKLKDAMKKYKKNIVIQGEVVGPGIQGNKLKLKEFRIYIFNLLIDGVIQDTNTLIKFCNEFGFKHVPILDLNYKLPKTGELLQEFATDSSKISNVLREGVVIRNYKDKISFKAISPEFLLKHGE